MDLTEEQADAFHLINSMITPVLKTSSELETWWDTTTPELHLHTPMEDLLAGEHIRVIKYAARCVVFADPEIRQLVGN